jgi:hypothetical protein
MRPSFVRHPDRDATHAIWIEPVHLFSVVAFAVLFIWTGGAHADEVTNAGFAYSGDAASIKDRFPLVGATAEKLSNSGSPIDASLRGAIKDVNNPYFTVNTTDLVDLKVKDRAIVVALVLSGESSSIEAIAGVYKVFVNLRADALFFDYKSLTVVRSYPISVAYVDSVAKPPTREEMENIARDLILGNKGPGLLRSYATQLSAAKLPGPGTKYVRVRTAMVSDEALADFPPSIKSSRPTVETMVAERFGTELSRTGVPLLPYINGQAIGGAMAMRFMDGSVFTLKIPDPDYAFEITLKGFKKIKYAEAAAGASYIYASFAHVKLLEPLSNHIYLDSEFKNGEVKVVSALQKDVADFPAYEDSLRGLFSKLSQALGQNGRGSPWLKASSSVKDIELQIRASALLLESCK